jgi:CPA1 family monovalent cation:H+ antiporter
MSAVDRFELILALMGAIIVLELAARRLHVPQAVAFVLGGMALALIPATPDIELDPDLTLVLFLPPLLLAGAFLTAWRDFRQELRIILQLAVGAVFFTTVVVGITAHLVVPGLPWAACFALGAIVSPPDAVAAKAVLHGMKLPERVVVLLQGESLVNDASGLVLYRFAVAAALTGAFSAGHAAIDFGVLAAGGVAIGIICGALASLLLARLQDPLLSIVGSFLAAWGSYISADEIGVSGVLSTVTCGLIMGWRQHEIIGAATRIQARAVWETVVFVLESLLFVLVGLSLRGVLDRLALGDRHNLAALLAPIAAVTAAVILSRFAWILPSTYLVRAIFPRLRRRDPFPPIGVPIVMSWAGMRGVVSLAAALALPDHFPGRDFVLAATFAVILVTVLVQGTTLAPLIRALRLDSFAGGRRGTIGEHETRARIAKAQLAAVEQASLGPDGTHRHPRLMDQYGARARASARYSEAVDDLAEARREHFGVVLSAIAAGRRELLRMHRAGEIHDTVLNTLERDLDLEELTARKYL